MKFSGLSKKKKMEDVIVKLKVGIFESCEIDLYCVKLNLSAWRNFVPMGIVWAQLYRAQSFPNWPMSTV